jgi:PAS domain S-box-containing protein
MALEDLLNRDDLPADAKEDIQKAIAEHKETKEDVRAAEDEKTGILAEISDAFFSLDESLVVTQFNPAAERLLGRSADDVLGRRLLCLLSGDFRAKAGRGAVETPSRAVREACEGTYCRTGTIGILNPHAGQSRTRIQNPYVLTGRPAAVETMEWVAERSPGRHARTSAVGRSSCAAIEAAVDTRNEEASCAHRLTNGRSESRSR